MTENAILDSLKQLTEMSNPLKNVDTVATREIFIDELSDIITKDNLFKDLKNSAKGDDKKWVQQEWDFWKQNADKHYKEKLKTFKSL